tara:strand:+ start:15577 stop:16656 length:1080 start_codon:yes stop_codon:yes gene_type:complete
MKLNIPCYKNKIIIITGHTGFKGSWLSLWLKELGAKIIGISREIVHKKGLYVDLSKKNYFYKEYFLDIKNSDDLIKTIELEKADFIFHLAAQPIVSESFKNPRDTFLTNTIGTLNILESVKNVNKKTSLIIITSDKCYENIETIYGYREIDSMGGKDPYSASKGCAELIANCYMRSIYNENNFLSIATARAGNVIGGGDWSKSRLIPDAVKAWESKKELIIRSPKATRPWQHVLEPISGYILLGEYIFSNKIRCSQLSDASFNFGPDSCDIKSVEKVVELFSIYWKNSSIKFKPSKIIQESGLLNLSYDKACNILNWSPTLGLEKALEFTATWYIGKSKGLDMIDLSIRQIKDFCEFNG